MVRPRSPLCRRRAAAARATAAAAAAARLLSCSACRGVLASTEPPDTPARPAPLGRGSREPRQQSQDSELGVLRPTSGLSALPPKQRAGHRAPGHICPSFSLGMSASPTRALFFDPCVTGDQGGGKRWEPPSCPSADERTTDWGLCEQWHIA